VDTSEYMVTDRGLTHMRPVPSEYGGEVKVYESSAAEGPHIWLQATAPVNLNEPDGPTHEVPIHLTAESAWRLAEQLRWLVEHHYQGDARPENLRQQKDPAPPSG
jgi:hypothetical protein